MRISYAQRLEDFYLDRVFAESSAGTYVDVGGGHPVADNVSYHFYLKGWCGLVVEPQAALAALYRHIRPRDVVVEQLVGRSEGEIRFHEVERLHGFSTTREVHARGAEAFGAGYRTSVRRVRPLGMLVREAGLRSIDFLKIDVEGAEADVLAGMDWDFVRPSVLCIEAVLPGSMAEAWSEWEPLLDSLGYRFTFFDELNRYYVAEEASALMPRFPDKPVDWGVCKHLYEFGKVHRSPDHPDRALADRLISGFLASLPERSEEELRALVSRGAPGGDPASEAEWRTLFRGLADFPGTPSAPGVGLLDDQARAALGRIAAEYDGGMISDE
jgi:FkbM family methyltransferase